MPGGRLRVYGRGAPKTPNGGKADKGLARQADILPDPKNPKAVKNAYTQINPNAVRGKRAK